jgi:integrase
MSKRKNTDSLPGSGHDIVLDETSFGRPSRGDFTSMARRRFQNPEPKLVGNWWQIRVYQDQYSNGRRKRPRKRIRLAPASTPVREVQKLAAEYLRPLNHGLITAGSATPYESLARDVYMTTVLPLMASSTQDRYRGILENYLIPEFGSVPLREMTSLVLQKFILGFEMIGSAVDEQTGRSWREGGRKYLSHESVDKIRDVLASSLSSAVKHGYLVTNPAEGLQVPSERRGKRRQKPFVLPEQFSALLELIQEPYATMVYTAVQTGLRVSELIALRWRNIHSDSISIDERYCRGDWSEPKSAASNTTIPVNRKVIDRIHRLRDLTVEVRAGRATRLYRVVKKDGPADLVFQSVKKGSPMRDNAILVRHIKPAGRKLGIPWVNWLVLRRSYATWLRMVGTDPRDRQSLMRHSRFTTTAEIYEQDLPESQRRAVEKIATLVK